MSQLNVEKQFKFSLKRIFQTLLNLWLNVFNGFCVKAKTTMKNMVSGVAKSTKLSSDNFSTLSINLSNKEPSTISKAEDFFFTWFSKLDFYEIKRIRETPLQVLRSCDKISQPNFSGVSCFVEFPNFKTKMII